MEEPSSADKEQYDDLPILDKHTRRRWERWKVGFVALMQQPFVTSYPAVPDVANLVNLEVSTSSLEALIASFEQIGNSAHRDQPMTPPLYHAAHAAIHQLRLHSADLDAKLHQLEQQMEKLRLQLQHSKAPQQTLLKSETGPPAPAVGSIPTLRPPVRYSQIPDILLSSYQALSFLVPYDQLDPDCSSYYDHYGLG